MTGKVDEAAAGGFGDGHGHGHEHERGGEQAARLRRGRVGAIAVFYGLVVVFILVCAGQVTAQAIGRPARGGEPIDCREGLRQLAGAVEAARQASEGVESVPEVALQRFRQALSPAWGARDRVEAACEKTGDRRLIEAFDVIERLRYAEENAVRRDARDLGPLHRHAKGLSTGPLSGGGR